MKAWLVTWEWVGDHAAVVDKIAAVLSPLWGVRRVADVVEFLYVRATADVEEMAREYAKSGVDRPYPPEIESELVTCGHNPQLFGRKVKDLTVSQNPETKQETITWTEYPRYKAQPDGASVVPKVTVPEQTCTITRRITGPLSDARVQGNKP